MAKKVTDTHTWTRRQWHIHDIVAGWSYKISVMAQAPLPLDVIMTEVPEVCTLQTSIHKPNPALHNLKLPQRGMSIISVYALPNIRKRSSFQAHDYLHTFNTGHRYIRSILSSLLYYVATLGYSGSPMYTWLLVYYVILPEHCYMYQRLQTSDCDINLRF